MALSPLQAGLLLAFLLVLAALLLAWRGAQSARSRSGLPRGQVVSADSEAWRPGSTLIAPVYGLSGKPDYTLRQGRLIIPVEVKPGRRATKPYDADILQLATYCLLVEQASNQRPPYGLLRYHEQTFRIPYTRRLEDELLFLLAQMRCDLRASSVPRSHADPRRCRFCGFGADCADSLGQAGPWNYNGP
jgi:CRISPR-associated exonuclease Cas4